MQQLTGEMGLIVSKPGPGGGLQDGARATPIAMKRRRVAARRAA